MKKLYLLLIALSLVTGVAAQSHFQPAFDGNGYDHMNIYLVEATIEGSAMQAGDEIAVFDGDICAGVFVLSEALIDSTIGFINASKADQDTSGAYLSNGYTPGNELRFKLWDASEGTEYDNVDITFIDPDSGQETPPVPFTVGASVFVEVEYTYINDIGNTEVYTSISTVNSRRAVPVTFTENGKIGSLSIYHQGGTGNMLLGVYTDDSGYPGTRIGITASTTVNEAAGWQTVELIDSVSVLSGETVWLAFVFENSMAIRYEVGAPGRATSTATWTSGLTPDFGTSSVADFNYSLYCTYSVDTTMVPILEDNDIGNTEVYTSISTVNSRRAVPVTFTENGKIGSLSIYHQGGTGNMLLGVYTDDSGYPGTRIGITASTTVNEAAGWQTVELIDSVSVLSGETVWLAFVFENSMAIRYEVGAPGRATSTATWTSGLTPDFGTSSVADFNYSLYCTYSVDTTMVPILEDNDIGNTEVYTSISTVNSRRAVPVTFTENGKIGSLSIYHQGGTGNMLLGVYTDDSGYPGTRIGITASTTVNEAAGWQTVELIDSVSVLSGETVWLAFVFENSMAIRYEVGAPGRATSTATWTSGLTPDFGTSSVADFNYSLYCTYSVDTTMVPILEDNDIGNTEVYTSISTVNSRRAVPVTFTENGKIGSLSIYHQGGTGNMLLGVYTDDSGYPGTRIGITASTTVNEAAGWQTVELIDSVSVLSGETVWLAFVFENSMAIRYEVGAPGRATSTATWTSGLTPDFGTSSVADFNYSLYCTYSVDTTMVPILEDNDIGNTEVYTSISTVNSRRAVPVTFTENGKIGSLSIYHQGGTGNMLLGVYTDDSGYPGTRIGITASTTVNEAAGWQTVELIDSVSVLSGETVWLAFVFENSMAIRYEVGAPGRATSTATWTSGLTPDFGTSSVADFNYSLYCTYSVDTTMVPILEDNDIGNTEVYTSISTVNSRRAVPVTFTENGKIGSLSIYHQGGTGNMLLGVYTDDSGYPGTRIGITASTTVNEAAGWQTVELIDSVSVLSGETVWLAFVFENSMAIRYEVGAPGRATSTATWTSGLTPDFGTSSVADFNYSLYCTYSVDTTMVPILEDNDIGNTEVYTSISTVNSRRAVPVTFTENGKIGSLSIYHQGGTGNMLLGVYTDDSGYPGTRIGITASTTVNEAAGWQTVELIDSVSVLSGETVWLAFVFENSMAIRYEVGAPGRATSTATWTSGLTPDFGTSSVADFNYSLYCTYSVDTTMVPILEDNDIGNTEVYTSISTVNSRRAVPVTFTENGKIGSLSIYHQGGTGNMLLGVYTDDSGYPGTRIGITASTTVNEAAGWQTVELIDSVSVLSGETVWLAFVFENSMAIRYEVGAPGRATSTATWTSGLTPDFGTSSVADFNYSLYCTYSLILPIKAAETEYPISTKGKEKKTSGLSLQEFFDIEVYPNPFTANLYIKFVENEGENININVYDINGRIIKEMGAEIVEGFNTLNWNATDASGNQLHPGMYLILVQSELRRETFKVVYQGN
ncbi:T9SS type A sorting domain-containing protein [uncultured Draconibacterium sp.]|uniref:T9SS type A sorting domain-containing protein n=1 Tax=uncultured Draconibacterium sp. TaxID=1573823 RepID=UPI003260619C